MSEALRVGKLRQQCALLPPDEAVYVKLGDRYYLAVNCWPDTVQAPAGRAFYVEVESRPVIIFKQSEQAK